MKTDSPKKKPGHGKQRQKKSRLMVTHQPGREIKEMSKQSMIRRQYITKAAFRKAMIFMLALLIGAAAGYMNYLFITAEADAGTSTAWILCQPGDWVNVRRRASTRSESLGRLETGDTVRITGKTKDGFAHALVSLEEAEGWVFGGYLVFDEPVPMDGRTATVRSSGRVACRKCVEGGRRCWVNDGDQVSVFYRTAEWCVTNKGFIKTEYLEVGAQ